MKNLEDMTLKELFLLHENENGRPLTCDQKFALCELHITAIQAYGRGLSHAMNALQEPLLEWAQEVRKKGGTA